MPGGWLTQARIKDRDRSYLRRRIGWICCPLISAKRCLVMLPPCGRTWPGRMVTSPKKQLKFAEEADRLLPADETAVRALNLTTLGNALIQRSDDPRSAEVLEQALLLAKQAGQSHVVMQAASGLAYTCILLGKSHRAQRVCEEAIEIAELYQRRNARPLTTAASVYAILSRVWLEGGEYEKALQIARKGMALAEVWGQVDTIMMCAQFLAFALSFTDQVEQARKLIQETRKVAQKGPPWHLQTLDFVELQIYLDSNPQNAVEIHREAVQDMSFLKSSPLLKRAVLIKKESRSKHWCCWSWSRRMLESMDIIEPPGCIS